MNVAFFKLLPEKENLLVTRIERRQKKKKIKREGQTINRNFQQHFPEDYTVFIFAATPGGTNKSFFTAALPSTERSEMKKKVLSNSQFILTS